MPFRSPVTFRFFAVMVALSAAACASVVLKASSTLPAIATPPMATDSTLGTAWLVTSFLMVTLPFSAFTMATGVLAVPLAPMWVLILASTSLTAAFRFRPTPATVTPSR